MLNNPSGEGEGGGGEIFVKDRYSIYAEGMNNHTNYTIIEVIWQILQ